MCNHNYAHETFTKHWNRDTGDVGFSSKLQGGDTVFFQLFNAALDFVFAGFGKAVEGKRRVPAEVGLRVRYLRILA